MNRSSTIVIPEKSWRFGNLHNVTMTILNCLKHSGRVMVDYGHGLNCSSAVAESGSFFVAL